MQSKKTGKLQAVTKGQVEAEISNALISFEREHMGRGPVEAKTYIIQDMVLIRLKGVLTPAERHLAIDEEGIQLIKQVRTKLMENAHAMLKEIIHKITGVSPVSLYTDISTKTGERFIIITFEEELEGRYRLN
ncbi:MAG: DUF2294 domain-containing protein [Desulfobacterales bacterium]|nr:DUF2294 domain-containing protein [Desulfobacterales bacterium]